MPPQTSNTTISGGGGSEASPSLRSLGWRMVAVAFCVDFIAVGFFFYSYGVFFKAIAEDFGGSRLGASLGLTVSATVGAIAAPLIGRALDRYPVRIIILLGALCMMLGFLWLSRVRSPLEFYAAIGVFIGVGAVAMGGLATSKLVANWFHRKRGMALGIAATGISMAGVVMPFVSAQLIDNFGWRTGFLAYAGFVAFVMLPFIWWQVISAPADVGLRPIGALPLADDAGQPSVTFDPDLDALPLLRDRNFWVMVLIFGLLLCCQSATLTHMVARVTDTGVSLQTASLVMSACATVGVAGKLSFGWLSDRWRARHVLWFCIVFQIIGQLLMFRDESLVVFTLGAVVFGYGLGGQVPMLGALVGRIFGSARYGRAMGGMRPGMYPIMIGGVPLAGWVHDTYGTYDPAFSFFLVLYVLAAIAVLAFREDQFADVRERRALAG